MRRYQENDMGHDVYDSANRKIARAALDQKPDERRETVRRLRSEVEALERHIAGVQKKRMDVSPAHIRPERLPELARFLQTVRKDEQRRLFVTAEVQDKQIRRDAVENHFLNAVIFTEDPAERNYLFGMCLNAVVDAACADILEARDAYRETIADILAME
jgi:hypothetical protein